MDRYQNSNDQQPNRYIQSHSFMDVRQCQSIRHDRRTLFQRELIFGWPTQIVCSLPFRSTRPDRRCQEQTTTRRAKGACPCIHSTCTGLQWLNKHKRPINNSSAGCSIFELANRGGGGYARQVNRQGNT